MHAPPSLSHSLGARFCERLLLAFEPWSRSPNVGALVDLGLGFQIGNQVLPGIKPQGPVQWVGFGLGAAWWYLSDE